MTIKDTAMQDMTYSKFRKLIMFGRRAIELRLVGILIRPRVLTEADRAELARVEALLAQFNELMSEKYWYKPPEAANDGDGASK